MTADLLADYLARGWALAPIPSGKKGPIAPGWQIREWGPGDFPAGGNVGVILGPRSGDLVNSDLDCIEALALAPIYLPPTGARFGRPSKPLSHWLYTSPGSVFEAFADPDTGETLLELRARGTTGGEHQTLLPPSIADGERRAWDGDIIEPAAYDAAKLRRRAAYLAVACLVRRHVSEQASERPAPDLPHLLYEAKPLLGRAAYHWLGIPDPDAPKLQPKLRRDYTRAEVDLAEVVAAIPNDADWAGWNRVGMAIFASCDGADFGGILFDNWSAKSVKYDPYVTMARWQHYHRSPPSRLSVGTLIHLARQAGWQPSRDVGRVA